MKQLKTRPIESIHQTPNRGRKGDITPRRKKMRYYDVVRYWTKRFEPHLRDPELNDILVKDFNRFTRGRWGQVFRRGQYPYEFETCDWAVSRRGPMPRFHKYVKHAACQWMVNFYLRLVSLAEPKRGWRIVTSDDHSTVWDSRQTLFDPQFMALGVPVRESWELARKRGRILRPGEYLEVFFACRATRNS